MITDERHLTFQLFVTLLSDPSVLREPKQVSFVSEGCHVVVTGIIGLN